MTLFRIACKTLLWLGFGLLGIVSIGPWLIMWTGSDYSGFLAAALAWYGAILAVPVGAVLIGVGGAGLLLTKPIHHIGDGK